MDFLKWYVNGICKFFQGGIWLMRLFLTHTIIMLFCLVIAGFTGSAPIFFVALGLLVPWIGLTIPYCAYKGVFKD